MTTRHADYFWIATLVVLAAVNLALYLHPENLSFSSRVAYWLNPLSLASHGVRHRGDLALLPFLEVRLGRHSGFGGLFRLRITPEVFALSGH